MPAWKAIAAVAENGVIGNGLEIPWRIPEDFRHFKRATMGGIVVMGRRTWESIGSKPLPGRLNVVISSSAGECEGAEVYRSLSDFKRARGGDPRQVWICGGAALYRSALGECSEILMSRVRMRPEGDVFFPDISREFREAGTVMKGGMFDVVRFVRV